MDTHKDLAYLRLAVPDLEEYLLSQVTFWPLPAGNRSINEPGMDQMTLGGVLLCGKRVEAAGDASARVELERIAQVRARWRSNWAKKASQEWTTRLQLWEKTLGDLLDRSTNPSAAYPVQVRIRVMLELLQQDLIEAPAKRSLLLALDHRLRSATQPGPFVWDAVLSGEFPEESYWFLYRQFA